MRLVDVRHFVGFLLALALGGMLPLEAKAPDWLRSLSQGPLPAYSEGSDAVVLLDEIQREISESGKVESCHRRAYRVLTASGTDVSLVVLPLTEEMKISDLKAWNLKEDGVEHEVSHKEGIETQLGDEYFYSDTSSLMLQIPRVEAGSVIGYEFKSSAQPSYLQQHWQPQGRLPVLQARFFLKLPKGWSFDHAPINRADIPLRQLGNEEWLCEISDLEAIPTEEGMPPLANLAATVIISVRPQEEKGLQTRVFTNWDEVGVWFEGLISPQSVPSTDIREKVGQLNSLRELSEFVQNEIRYVAIEVGTGGYRPHSAAETFKHKYGDCKDKVTLLKSMLQVVGRKLYPVLISSQREMLVARFPSPHSFDHVIAAVPVTEGENPGPAVLHHSELGDLLFLDVTDRQTPFGELPSALQATQALLIRDGGSHVIETPVAAPSYNRILRTGQFQVLPNGMLKGKVREVYRGMPARRERAAFLEMQRDKWIRLLEAFVGRYLPGVLIGEAGAGEIEDSGMIAEKYTFAAPYGCQRQGDLLLLRPCILGSKAHDWTLKEERRYPFQFGYLRVTSDLYEFELPEGATVEHVPEPLELDLPFAGYSSSIAQEGNQLKYVRKLEIRELEVPAEKVGELHAFYQQVIRDECKMVLLRVTKREVDAGSGEHY